MAETHLELRVDNLTKRFGLRTIFSNINLSLSAGDILAVTGRNGSGKSTFLKILANVAELSAGSVRWSRGGGALDQDALPLHLGFVAPYLQLYTEFSAWEHVELMQEMRGLEFDKSYATELFDHFGLAGRRNDRIGTFSSGMLQRVKFICAEIHRPSFLLLDEPMSNLDLQGIAAMRELITRDSDRRITLIATNEEEDVRLCSKMVSVEGVRSREFGVGSPESGIG